MIFLSIIVCTYNREILLKNCLDELIKQMPPYVDSTEVIVVDNNCVDGTASMVKQLCDIYPWLKYVLESKQGLSNARNGGAKIAQGYYICYLDDDGKPNEKYLSWVHHVLNKHKPDIAGGPVYPYYTTPKPRWFKDEFEIRRHAQTSVFSNKCSISGGNFIIRSQLLKHLGMFSPEFGMIGNKTRLGDEKALLIKYRSTTPIESRRVYYSQECFIYHHVPPSKMHASYFFKRGFFSGRALVLIKNEPRKMIFVALKMLTNNLFIQLPLALIVKGSKKKHPVLILQQIGIDVGKLSMHVQNFISGTWRWL